MNSASNSGLFIPIRLSLKPNVSRARRFSAAPIDLLSWAGDAVRSAWLPHRFAGGPIDFRRIREVAGWLALLSAGAQRRVVV